MKSDACMTRSETNVRLDVSGSPGVPSLLLFFPFPPSSPALRSLPPVQHGLVEQTPGRGNGGEVA